MKRNKTTRFLRSNAQFVFGSVALALVTFACFRLGLNLAAAAFGYFIVIVLLSLMGSFFVSAVLSIMAVGGLNYFFAPPLFDFRIDYPQDLVLVIAFVLTSLIVTGLVERGRRRTEAALQAEARAEEAERELRLAVDAIPAMVGSARPDGFLNFFNQRWLEYLGRPLEDVQGWGWKDAIHLEDLVSYMDRRRVVLATGEPFESEVRLRGADGKYRWFLQRAAALRDGHGNIVKWYEATSDIEDRKRAEEVLREQARLLDLTHDTVFVRDTNDSITYWNRGAELLYGWTRDEALGKSSHQLMQTVFPEAIEEIMEKLLGSDRWEGELVHTKRDGTQVTVLSRWALLRDRRGTPVATLETNNDITERKQAEEALRQAQADLAHVSRVTTMGELTASLAHDVNQPIAAAVTNANACLRWLAGDTPNLEEARAASMRIAKDGTRAAEIVSRLRLLFKKDTPERELVDVNEIIREMILLLHGEVTRHSISVRTELAADLPQVMGDRVQLQQVVMNLIMNSIDAMKDVAGTREIAIKSQRAENEQVMVSISDTGVGLPTQQADKIFVAFFTTKVHGIGMGLSISRSIIESHGGCLWAADNPPDGASFHLTLPTKAEGHE